jgi:hypothetical protein
MYWIPTEIIEEFGDVFGGMTMGRAVLFNAEDTDKIVSAFAELGYTCVEDKDLVYDANWAQWGR